MEKSKADFFSYLAWDSVISFSGGRIAPRQDFNKVVAWIKQNSNRDGFLYPPVEHLVTRSFAPEKKPEVMPNSKRPALLHRIPPSHELYLDATGERDVLRKSAGGFVVHLLAYLFGIRLQFYDWWFDGRVPIESTHNSHVSEKAAEDFLSHCYQKWRTWPEAEQRLMTNILYMHSRAPSYEWDWEQFAIEYMVVDGCWRLAAQQYNFPICSHKERINVLCRKFGIPLNDVLVKDIVELRNNLFHETLWDKSQPCTAPNGPGFAASLHIRKLNQRLIPAILGYSIQYVSTPWWLMGTFCFK